MLGINGFGRMQGGDRPTSGTIALGGLVGEHLQRLTLIKLHVSRSSTGDDDRSAVVLYLDEQDTQAVAEGKCSSAVYVAPVVRRHRQCRSKRVALVGLECAKSKAKDFLPCMRTRGLAHVCLGTGCVCR